MPHGHDTMAANRYLIDGRVQGVGYRYFVQREADRLGVSGFVRNLADGRVEVVAEGSDEALASLEARLKEGPAFSSVSHVERAAIARRGDQGFQIR
jgi:acylphosphatase